MLTLKLVPYKSHKDEVLIFAERTHDNAKIRRAAFLNWDGSTNDIHDLLGKGETVIVQLTRVTNPNG